MSKIILAKIGIDPGVSNGGISALVQTTNGFKLVHHKMAESFRDIKELLKPYAGSPFETETRCSVEKLSMRPMQSAFITARMQPMIRNFDRIKDALTDLDIPYQEVAPVTWQKYHNLTIPKNSEKGVDYERLSKLKKDAKQIPLHSAIERNILNDVVLTEHVKYILSTSGRKAARIALKDDFAYFTKFDLNKGLKEIEKEIDKIKNKEKQVRKKRYQARAQKIIGGKVTLWQADAILLLTYEKYNPCQIIK